MAEFAARVMGVITGPGYRPMTLKALSRELLVEAADYPDFRRLVKSLINDGKLHVARDKTLSIPDRSGMIVGLFRRSSKGFGFVRPHGAGRGPEDVYIPPEATRDASSGDEVTVKITRPARRGGASAEGRIVEVLSRSAAVFVGTYYEAGDTSFVKVDGTTFHEPISVGDPGAKGRGPATRLRSRSRSIHHHTVKVKELSLRS